MQKRRLLSQQLFLRLSRKAITLTRKEKEIHSVSQAGEQHSGNYFANSDHFSFEAVFKEIVEIDETFERVLVFVLKSSRHGHESEANVALI